MPDADLPDWAQELRSTYLRGEASVFILYGNVYDLILHDAEMTTLVEFLSNVLLKAKDFIVHYNQAGGIRFRRKERALDGVDELIGLTSPDKALPKLEQLLLTQDGLGVIIDYAEMIAPASDTSFQGDADRKTVVSLHRWSLDRRFDQADNAVILIAEQLTQLSEKLVSNPKIASIEVKLPNLASRKALIQLLEPDAQGRDLDRLAELSAGLKNQQIRGILLPAEDESEDVRQREAFIARLLGGTPDALARAKLLAPKFAGESHEEIQTQLGIVAVPAIEPGEPEGRFDEVFRLLEVKKRKILERECFGLIEFVEPAHDFASVGGFDEIKKELMTIAKNIKEGARNRVPMGLLFVGPMGTGKTFVAEAFAKSSGLSAIKLKNFRSKWVGSTEGNLEKILSVVKAIGNILVIIDEGDRAFGGSNDESDGGTSSRVIARIKEFMSDTTNRGRVLFVLMTNRPDKLDIDIKRAGRLDRKIPFFYAVDPAAIELVLRAQFRRYELTHSIEFPRDRNATSQRLVGYSNADIEAVTLLALNMSHAEECPVTPELFGRAIDDFLPSRDDKMLEYMELLAVFESSSRQMLPERYKDIKIDDLHRRLRELRMGVAG